MNIAKVKRIIHFRAKVKTTVGVNQDSPISQNALPDGRDFRWECFKVSSMYRQESIPESTLFHLV